MPLPEITEDIIRNLSNDSSYWKGMNYYDNGNLKKLWTEGDKYIAHVQGYELYTVKIRQEEEEIRASCTCPYDFGGICKHVVATMIAINNSKESGRYKRESNEIWMMLDALSQEKVKEFLFEALLKGDSIRDDFRIFAKGEEETDKAVEDYKRDIHKLFETLRGRYYHHHDDYYGGDYHSPADGIINGFSEAAEKYSRQKNYKEAIKIYRAIYESCYEALEDERLEDFHDDISYGVGPALKKIAENIGKLDIPLDSKKVYFSYIVECYKKYRDWDAELFEYIFRQILKSSEEAGYLLNITASILLDPSIKFNILLIKGNLDETITYGESNLSGHPEIALPLSDIYLKQRLKDKAVETAEKGLGIFEKRDGKFQLDFSSKNGKTLLRRLLNDLYDKERDYEKIKENLLNLFCLEEEVEYYHRLKELLKTDEEKTDLIIKVEKILKDRPEMLFKIYSIEQDYGRLLNLAGRSLDYDLFHSIVNKIKERHPEDCFKLYKNKIDRFLESATNRNAYRQATYFLKLMKQIPGTGKKFENYIDLIRTKYKRRHALMDELKHV